MYKKGDKLKILCQSKYGGKDFTGEIFDFEQYNSNGSVEIQTKTDGSYWYDPSEVELVNDSKSIDYSTWSKEELLEKAKNEYKIGVKFKSIVPQDENSIRTIIPFYEKDTECIWEYFNIEGEITIMSENGIKTENKCCSNPYIYKSSVGWAEIVSKPEMKITLDDLEKDKYYTYRRVNNPDKWNIFKSKGKTQYIGSIYYSIINLIYEYCSNSSFNPCIGESKEIIEYRVATQEEIDWLDLCISANKFVEKPILNKKQFYNTKIFIGRNNADLGNKVIRFFEKLGMTKYTTHDFMHYHTWIETNSNGEIYKNDNLFKENSNREISLSDLGIIEGVNSKTIYLDVEPKSFDFKSNPSEIVIRDIKKVKIDKKVEISPIKLVNLDFKKVEPKKIERIKLNDYSLNFK